MRRLGILVADMMTIILFVACKKAEESCYTKYMQFSAFFGWWYGAGWADQVGLAKVRLAKANDFFSIPLLVKNLFQPFRQISVGKVKGSLDVVLRAWLHQIISRWIGSMIRTVMIVIGMLWLFVVLAVNMLWLLAWPLFPVFPLVGVAVAIIAGGV